MENPMFALSSDINMFAFEQYNASMRPGKCKPTPVIGLQLHYSRIISIPCDEITLILRVGASVNIKQVARH